MFSNAALKKLILPLFLDQLLLIGVGIASTMMISYAGEAAVSGVSLVEMINMLMLSVLMALSTGGAVVVSQYIGSKEAENSRVAASQLVTVTTFISVILTALVLLLHKPVLNLLFGKVDKEVMEAAVLYFLIVGFSYPFFALYNSGAAIYRSMGISRVPMIVSIGMNVTNLILNAVGIFGLKWGVAGVAYAALISRILAGVLMLALCFNKNNPIYLESAVLRKWNPEMLRRILRIGVPNSVENGLSQLGRLLLVSVVALLGTTQITANGVANSLVMVSISFALAINFAIVTVVGQCVGAGDFDQARLYVKKLMKLAYIGTLVLCILEVLALPWMLNLFSISKESRDLAYWLVFIHNGLAIFIWPLSFVLPSGLRAAGDVRYTMGTSIVAMFLFRVLFSYLLAIVLEMGILGIWIAMCIDWVVRSLLYVWRFKNGKWMNFRIV